VIILGSIPVMRPLVDRIHPSGKGSNASEQYSYDSRSKFTKLSTASRGTESTGGSQLLSTDVEQGQDMYVLSSVSTAPRN
jgi:hypothetical protein